MAETLHELQSLISAHFGIPVEDLDADRTLEEFGLDSLGVIELIFNIEDHYDIKMPEDGPKVTTLKELALWVDDVRAAACGTSAGQ